MPSRRYREGKHCVGLRRLPEPVRLMPHSFLSLSLMNWQVACYWHDDDNKIKQIKKNNNHDLPSILWSDICALCNVVSAATSVCTGLWEGQACAVVVIYRWPVELNQTVMKWRPDHIIYCRVWLHTQRDLSVPVYCADRNPASRLPTQLYVVLRIYRANKVRRNAPITRAARPKNAKNGSSRRGLICIPRSLRSYVHAEEACVGCCGIAII